mgnify:CR=1 FL=1
MKKKIIIPNMTRILKNRLFLYLLISYLFPICFIHLAIKVVKFKKKHRVFRQ